MSLFFFLRLDLSRFTSSGTHVVKSCSSNFTAFYYFDLFYQRRVDRESLFHAYSGSDSSYSESLADSAVLSLQNKAFKNLNSFSVSFFDLSYEWADCNMFLLKTISKKPVF